MLIRAFGSCRVEWAFPAEAHGHVHTVGAPDHFLAELDRLCTQFRAAKSWAAAEMHEAHSIVTVVGFAQERATITTRATPTVVVFI